MWPHACTLCLIRTAHQRDSTRLDVALGDYTALLRRHAQAQPASMPLGAIVDALLELRAADSPLGIPGSTENSARRETARIGVTDFHYGVLHYLLL